MAASATPLNGVNFFARWRLDSSSFTINRMETGVDVTTSRFDGQVRYMQEAQDPATGLPVQDIDFHGEFFVLKNWGFTAYGAREFNTGVWQQSDFGIVYRDECIRVEIVYRRNNTNNGVLGPSQASASAFHSPHSAIQSMPAPKPRPNLFRREGGPPILNMRTPGMRSLSLEARALFGSAAGLAAALVVGASGHAQDTAPAAAAQAPAPAAAAPAVPQGLTENVVAHVNDDVITNYDIIQRMRLLVVTAGIQPTRDDLPELQR